MCACVREARAVRVLATMWVSRYIDTGWRRLIGSPRLQIIFHKRATKYRSLLRKITNKDKGSYESSPPCVYMYTFTLYLYIYIHVHIYTYIYVNVHIEFIYPYTSI